MLPSSVLHEEQIGKVPTRQIKSEVIGEMFTFKVVNNFRSFPFQTAKVLKHCVSFLMQLKSNITDGEDILCFSREEFHQGKITLQ